MSGLLISSKHRSWVEDWKIVSLIFSSEGKESCFIYIFNILYSVNDRKMPRDHTLGFYINCLSVILFKTMYTPVIVSVL